MAATSDVTSSTADTYVNTTGDLTSSSGNSGTASATLTVTGIVDQDGDGVPDNLDNCPFTPPGGIVDPSGCTINQLLNLCAPNDIGCIVAAIKSRQVHFCDSITESSQPLGQFVIATPFGPTVNIPDGGPNYGLDWFIQKGCFPDVD